MNLPTYTPTEATMAEFRHAELCALRDYWVAQWNAMKGVHAIQQQQKVKQ